MTEQQPSGKAPQLGGHTDRLLPTLLDRLTDLSPQREQDTVSELAMTRKQLRQIVLRDLTWLLNAINSESELALDDFEQVRSSTLNYGLPPFSGKRLSNTKLSELESAISSAILLFEPRIMKQSLAVKATLSTEGEFSHNTVIFEIRGQIWAQPYPVELQLKSSIDLETGFVSLLDQLGES